jgi:hypothetical protein
VKTEGDVAFPIPPLNRIHTFNIHPFGIAGWDYNIDLTKVVLTADSEASDNSVGHGDFQSDANGIEVTVN